MSSWRGPTFFVASLVVASTTLAAVPAVATVTQTLTADADAYVRADTPATNYGTKSALLVDASPVVYQSYLRFTVPAGEGSVASSRLRLFATDEAGNGGTVYRVDDDTWGETTIVWNTKPALGAAATPVGAVPLNGWVDLDVASYVSGAGVYSFAITTPSTNGSDYASRSNSTVANRPQLVVEWTGPAPDTTAPSVPQGLGAAPTSPTGVHLSWDPATDDTGVAGYNVYRDGEVVGSTATTSFDDAVTPGSMHSYQVDAFDAAGNVSEKAPPIQATTPTTETYTFGPDADAYVRPQAPGSNYGARSSLHVDTSPAYQSYIRFVVPPWVGAAGTAIIRLHATNGTGNGGSLRRTTDGWTESAITWNNRPALGIVVGPVGTVTAGAWTEIDVSSQVAGAGTYSFAIEALSSDGADFDAREAADGALRPQLVVTTGSSPDTVAPSVPQDLTATATGPTTVVLDWSSSTDQVGVSGYTVFRGGTPVGSVATPGFTDAQVQPETAYTYEVAAFDAAGNTSVRSTPASVTTPPGQGGPINVAAVGDVACDPSDPAFNDLQGTIDACRMMATRDVVNAIDPSVLLMLGDAQEYEGTYAQYLAAYDQVWGVFKPITWPVPGNRDYLTPGAAGYFQYFGAAAGEPGKGYYSVDVGAWHVIALNSNCAYVACGAGSAQEQWLRADLTANDAACTVAMFHHPRFSSRFATDPAYEAFWNAMYEFDVDLVLNGHAQFYERFAPQTPSGTLDTARGIRQLVVGTGGERHHNIRTIQPNSEVVNNTTFGVLELTFHQTSYDWRFVGEAGASFSDAGSAGCH